MSVPRSDILPADRFRIVASIAADLDSFAAEHYGLELEPLADSVGLSCDDFQSNEKQVSLDRMCRLFELLAIATGDEDFGVRYGEAITFGSTGFFGYGQKSAPTLRQLLSFNASFMPLVCDISYLSLEIDSSLCWYHWSFHPMIISKTQFSLSTSAMLVRLIRENFDANWSPNEVRFDFPRPKNARAINRLICPNLIFEEPTSTIIMSTHSLDLKNRNGDARLHELIYQNCKEQLADKRVSKTILDAVIDEISDSISDPQLSLSRTARRIGMSERSLQRYLSSQEQSFSELVDQRRKELSDTLLRDPNIPLNKIAERLGFSSNSAYTRTARRWYGVPPTEARRNFNRSSE